MAINTEELQLVLKEIKARPEEWDQTHWGRRLIPGAADKTVWVHSLEAEGSCGTAACFAGHAVLRAGYKFVFPIHVLDARFCIGPDCIGPDAVEEPVSIVAQRLLGLRESEANWLFGATNSLEDLELIVDELCRRADRETLEETEGPR